MQERMNSTDMFAPMTYCASATTLALSKDYRTENGLMTDKTDERKKERKKVWYIYVCL
jgi:hypothetical protein